jgi:hypothetical protein
MYSEPSLHKSCVFIDDEFRACMLIRFQSAIKDCPETSLRICSAAGYWRVLVLFDPRANED